MAQKRSEELYTKLFEAAGWRLRESLDRVRQACDFFDSVSADINPTRIGKYCTGNWGGPKMQSIRNADATLFAYLKLRRAEQVIKPKRGNETFEPVIRDETIKSYVEIIKVERDQAIMEKNRIIAGLRTLPGVPIDKFIRDGHVPQMSNSTENTPHEAPRPVDHQVKLAIERLFNGQALAAVGLELYRKRIRNAITNTVLLEKPMVESLMALVQYSEPVKNAPVIDEAPRNLLR